jgi:hypothetical protein
MATPPAASAPVGVVDLVLDLNPLDRCRHRAHPLTRPGSQAHPYDRRPPRGTWGELACRRFVNSVAKPSLTPRSARSLGGARVYAPLWQPTDAAAARRLHRGVWAVPHGAARSAVEEVNQRIGRRPRER